MVKATIKDKKVNIEFEGSHIEIANAVLNLIRSLMGSLKTEDPLTHLAALKKIADDPTILTGDPELDFIRRDDLSPLVKMMSDKTDESVIG